MLILFSQEKLMWKTSSSLKINYYLGNIKVTARNCEPSFFNI